MSGNPYGDWISVLAAQPLPTGRSAYADELAMLARLRGALDAREARVLAGVEALDDRGLPASAMARTLGRCSQREADRKARRAATLARVPSAAEALARGELTVEHVDALSRAVEATSPEAVERSSLVADACRRPADLAARDARDWARRHERDTDVEARQRRRHQARRLSIFENDDGMTVIHGEFDPVTGARLRKAVDAETNRLFHTDGGRGSAGTVRTPEQRRADALTALITGAAEGSGEAPVRTQFLATFVVDDGEITAGHLPDGQPLASSLVEQLACGSDLFALVLSQAGDPLWLGPRVRLATDGQWRALIARDGGCVICDADPSRCEAHHLIAWRPPGAGPTDIDNLVLLCGHHHHLVHDAGWHLVRLGDGGWVLRPP